MGLLEGFGEGEQPADTVTALLYETAGQRMWKTGTRRERADGEGGAEVHCGDLHARNLVCFLRPLLIVIIALGLFYYAGQCKRNLYGPTTDSAHQSSNNDRYIFVYEV